MVDIVHTLQEYTRHITVVDPWVDSSKAQHEYGIEVLPTLPTGITYDAAMLAVAHNTFRDLDVRTLVPQPGVIYDVKGVLPRQMIDARL